MKSEPVPLNLVDLCSSHHRLKTENGRRWRPPLIEYARVAEKELARPWASEA